MMGIGQGYTAVTPIQDVRWLDAVATGKLVTPFLGLNVSGAAGAVAVAHTGPESVPFAAELGPVDQGLALEVTQGTGTMLRNLPEPAGGKTGTAQDPSAPHGGPDAWYAAVYPVQDPEVVVLCAVHGGGQGYYDCEPSVDELLQYFAAHAAEITSMTRVTAPPPGGSSLPTPAPSTPTRSPATGSTTSTPDASNPARPGRLVEVAQPSRRSMPQ